MALGEMRMFLKTETSAFFDPGPRATRRAESPNQLDRGAGHARDRAGNGKRRRIEIAVHAPVVQHHRLARHAVRHVERIENRRKHVGPDVGGKSAAQRRDRVHLPAADQLAGDPVRQPRLARPERQLVRRRSRRTSAERRSAPRALTRDVVRVHRDAGAAVLRVRIRPGAARFQVLLDGVVHQQRQALRIALLHPEVDRIVIVASRSKTPGSPCR